MLQMDCLNFTSLLRIEIFMENPLTVIDLVTNSYKWEIGMASL